MEAVKKGAPVIDMSMPEPDPRLKSGKFKDIFSFFGPGIIIASATIGNGEIYSATKGGAVFGYVFLWTFLIGVIMKGLVVYSGSRYIAITGEHPFSRWGRIIPGPKNWLALLLGFMAIISFPSWASSYMITLGQWTAWVFGLPEQYYMIYGTIWAVIGFSTFFISAYEKVEKFQSIIVALMVGFVIIAMFASKPDWLQVFRGLIPTVPSDYAQWVKDAYPDVAKNPISMEVISYLGAMGGGSYDYIGYVGMYREKEWGILGNPNLKQIEAQLAAIDGTKELPLSTDKEDLDKAHAWLKALQIDNIFSFGSVFLFSIAFMILGAVILGENGLQKIPGDKQIMQYQVAFFSGISEFLVYFYQLAVWCAFFGSMQSLPTTVYPHTIRESLGTTFTFMKKEENWNKLKFASTVFFFGSGLFLMWSGASYTKLISFASILGGVLSLGIWGIAQVYTEKKMLPKEYRMSPITTVLVIISSIALGSFGLIALVQFFQSLF